MKLIKIQSEIRVFRKVDKTIWRKLMFVYKYDTNLVLLKKTEKAFLYKFTTTVDRFSFRNNINEFEGIPKVSSKTICIPITEIISETDELLEISNWLAKKEQLHAFTEVEKRENIDYQVVTEEFLRSKYPPLKLESKAFL